MIKLVYCITKKPELSQQEFSRYWKEVHGRLGARIPGLRKLVQSHVLLVYGMREADFDGMAELWFDDLESLLEARNSPEWAESTADEENFVDRWGVATLVTEEHQIV